jgi:hypothetical protein
MQSVIVTSYAGDTPAVRDDSNDDPFDVQGQRHMECVADRGTFDDAREVTPGSDS